MASERRLIAELMEQDRWADVIDEARMVAKREERRLAAEAKAYRDLAAYLEHAGNPVAPEQMALPQQGTSAVDLSMGPISSGQQVRV